MRRWLVLSLSLSLTLSCVGRVGAANADAGGGAGDGVAGVGFGFEPVGAPIALAGAVNASDITWKPATDTFFVVADRAIHEYASDFSTRLRTIDIAAVSRDPEGITYLGTVGSVDRFALAVEVPSDVVLTFDLAPGATSVEAPPVRTYVPAPPSPIMNTGWEGVAYRPAVGGGAAWLYASREGEPGQVAIRVVRFPYQPDGLAPTTLSYADGSLAVEEPWDALARLGDVAGDLSGLHYDTSNDTLLVVSHLGSRLLRVDPATGTILAQLILDRSPQYEGVTLTADGRMVLVSEPNFVEIFRRRGSSIGS